LDRSSHSIFAFFASFVLASVALSAVMVFGFGWYETKWSPAVNFAIDTAGLLLVGAIATGAFAVSVSLNDESAASPKRALLGGLLLAPAFMLVALLSRDVQHDLLAHAINWGTLLIGAGATGMLAHIKPPAHDQEP
jgi:hypothetical protein